MNELILELEDGRKSFQPSDSIRGTARWRLELPPEELEVRLFWYTQGKGDQDVGGVESERIVAPGAAGSHEFSFTAPPAPHSFSGTLISLLWAVELVLPETANAAREDIVIAPAGREIRLASVEATDGGGSMESS